MGVNEVHQKLHQIFRTYFAFFFPEKFINKEL